MNGHRHVTKGYSPYTNIPTQETDYGYESRQPGNWYVVETRTIERVRVPAAGYPIISRLPSETEHRYLSEYQPQIHHDEDDREKESLMNQFLNKINIEVNSPKKSGNVSSPTYRYPSDEAHLTKAKNLFGSSKYQPTSPMHNYPSKESHLTRAKNALGPKKYQPTSSDHSYPFEEGYLTKADSPLGRKKYQPPSTEHGYSSDEDGYLTKDKKPSSPNKYRTTSPEHRYPSEEVTKDKTPSGPKKYQPTSQEHDYHPNEGYLSRTNNSLSPKRGHPSSLDSEGGQLLRMGNFSVPNNHWLSAGPPPTHHPLTTPTNDIDEALGFLADSANYNSPRSNQKRTGVFDGLSPRAQPIKSERRYTRSPVMGPNVIDSHEAMRKYNGALVP